MYHVQARLDVVNPAFRVAWIRIAVVVELGFSRLQAIQGSRNLFHIRPCDLALREVFVLVASFISLSDGDVHLLANEANLSRAVRHGRARRRASVEHMYCPHCDVSRRYFHEISSRKVWVRVPLTIVSGVPYNSRQKNIFWRPEGLFLF